MFRSITFEVIGHQRLVCAGCAQRIECALREQPGVQKARANVLNQRIDVLFDAAALDVPALADRIAKAGYQTRVVSSER